MKYAACPPAAVHTWFLLTRQWLPCGVLPLQLRQVRMVNLVKPHKIQANRRLSVSDCRPISAWLDNNLPAEIGARADTASR